MGTTADPGKATLKLTKMDPNNGIIVKNTINKKRLALKKLQW